MNPALVHSRIAERSMTGWAVADPENRTATLRNVTTAEGQYFVVVLEDDRYGLAVRAHGSQSVAVVYEALGCYYAQLSALHQHEEGGSG